MTPDSPDVQRTLATQLHTAREHRHPILARDCAECDQDADQLLRLITPVLAEVWLEGWQTRHAWFAGGTAHPATLAESRAANPYLDDDKEAPA
jgi:hypothetical protein